MDSDRFSFAITIATGLLLTATLYYLVNDWERESFNSEFERRVSNHAVDLQANIDLHVEILESIAGLFHSSNQVDRVGFRNFVTPILERYSEIQGYS